MKFKYILYENNKLYKLYPYLHQLDSLTAENLRIMINSARYQIRVAKKRFDYNKITDIYKELEKIYQMYSAKNKTSTKYFESFEKFIENVLCL